MHSSAFFIQSILFRGTRTRAPRTCICRKAGGGERERERERERKGRRIDFARGRGKISRRRRHVRSEIRRYVERYASKKETAVSHPPPAAPSGLGPSGKRWRRNELGQIAVGSCDRARRRARRAFYSSATFVCGKTYSRGATLAKFCVEGYWKFRFV